MSSPRELNANFRFDGVDYNVNLVKGSGDGRSVQINGMSYTVLGEQDKLDVACRILGSISGEPIVSSADLASRLRELPGADKVHGIGVDLLHTSGSSGMERLNLYVDKLKESDFFSGVVLIAKGDELIRHEAIMPKGLDQPPFTEDSVFNCWSVGKVFTSVAIMQLVEKGNIRLDQPIKELLTLSDYRLEGCDQGYERDRLDESSLEVFSNSEVTVDQLLTHTGGLIESPTAPTQFDKGKVGKDYIYSNLGFLLLARIVANNNNEKLPFVEYVEEHIFKPTGATVSHSPEKPMHFDNNRPSGNARAVDRHIPAPDGNGCFWVTSTDLLKVAQGISNNTLLAQATKTVMQTPVIQDHARGFEVAGTGSKIDPYRMMKGGNFEGASSGLFIIDGKEPVTLICLSNLTTGRDILPEMCDVLVNEDAPIEPLAFNEELRKVYLSVKSLDINDGKEIRETAESIQPPALLGEILLELESENQSKLISAILANLPATYLEELKIWLTQVGHLSLIEK